MPLLLCMVAVAIQSQTVTASFPPTPIAKALSILGKATGQKLAVSSALSEEVMVLSVKDAPTDAVMQHIAEVFLAKWQRQLDGTLYLTPDLGAQKRHEDEEARKGYESLARSLTYLSRRLDEQPAELNSQAIKTYQTKLKAADAKLKAAEANEDWDHAFVDPAVREESPAWRALARILPMIGIDPMLRMPHRAREVWAENPTHMQHPLPEQAASVLAVYRRELSLLDPTMNVARVKVVVARWEDGDGFSGELMAEDASGAIINQSVARLNDDSAEMKIPFSERSKFPAKPGEKPLPISQECLDARIALSNSSKDPNRLKIMQVWKPKMEVPARLEPTAWYQGADLRTAAEAVGKNLIGSVSDTTTGNYWTPEPLTPTQFLAKNTLNLLPSSDGWLIYRNHEHVTRASRNEGQAFIRHSIDRGGVSVDDAAAWAAKSDDIFPFINWFGDYLHVLFPGRGPYSALATTLDAIGLRLWDSLGEAKRADLKRGSTIRLTDLTSESKAEIAKLVYWYDGLDTEKADPTEVLPNGIADGTVTLTIQEKPVIIAWSGKKGPPDVPMPLDAGMLGKGLVSGSTYWSMPPSVFQSWDTYRVGVNREYALHFTIQPGALPMTVTLSETLFDPSKQPVDKLPDDIQKEVEAARAAEIAKPKKAQTKDVIPPR